MQADSIISTNEELICDFTVEGAPVPKSRPRATSRGQMYTPDDTRAAQAHAGWIAKQAMDGKSPNDSHPILVGANFYCPVLGRRGDVDNFLKLILDACNGIVWRDDSQVVSVSATIVFPDFDDSGDPRPRTEIAIYALDGAKFCLGCEKPLKWQQRNSGRKFCSRTCYDEAQRAGKYVTCSGCGSVVYRNNEKLALNKEFYCSVACRSVALRGDVVCRQCGEAFKVHKSAMGRRAFCSPACSESYMRKRYDEKKNKNFPGTCTTCGGGTCRETTTTCRACWIKQGGNKKKTVV